MRLKSSLNLSKSYSFFKKNKPIALKCLGHLRFIQILLIMESRVNIQV